MTAPAWGLHSNSLLPTNKEKPDQEDSPLSPPQGLRGHLLLEPTAMQSMVCPVTGPASLCANLCKQEEEQAYNRGCRANGKKASSPEYDGAQFCQLLTMGGARSLGRASKINPALGKQKQIRGRGAGTPASSLERVRECQQGPSLPWQLCTASLGTAFLPPTSYG